MCKLCKSPKKFVVKKGFFQKKNKRIQRYRCKACQRSFSDQTHSTTYQLKKPHLRQKIFRLICSGVSQRRIAFNLGIHQDTVANQLYRIAPLAQKQNNKLRSKLKTHTVVFDEMETFEHTKCKPLSICVAVEDKTRRIIDLRVAQMPAKGHLARISRGKYGIREDLRPEAIRKTLGELKKNPKLLYLKSDESPRYPKHVDSILPRVTHVTYKGRRGCVVGQGELKRGGWDPLFYLNHTCAEIRDCVKRLSRRTWCTTKKPEWLQWILDLYMCYFNQKLAGVRMPVV